MVNTSLFDIVVIEIPLRMRTGPRRAVTHNLLVAAHDESGYKGWGETCPRPEVAGETLERARDTLRADILPGLLGLEFDSFDALVDVVGRRLDSLRRDQLAAFCAAEMALLWHAAGAGEAVRRLAAILGWLAMAIEMGHRMGEGKTGRPHPEVPDGSPHLRRSRVRRSSRQRPRREWR